VLSFQSTQCGKGWGWGEITLKCRNLTTSSASRSQSTSTVINHIGSVHLWCDVMQFPFNSVVCFLKTHNHSLIMRKTSDKSNWGTVYKMPNKCPSELSRSSEISKAWELSLQRGAKGDVVTKCTVLSTAGSEKGS
jgi:hypothetical protein